MEERLAFVLGSNTIALMEKELFKAAKNGDLVKIKELIEADPNLVHARDADESSPLHYAVWKGHREVVEFLLDSGADINVHNKNDHWGTTPLHAAAHANEAKIAELLIGRGALIDAKDLNGKSPLHHTTMHNATTAAKVLKSHGATE